MTTTFEKKCEIIIHFNKGIRRSHSLKSKLSRLETLESKLSCNKVIPYKICCSKQSTILDQINHSKVKQVRSDNFGTPIVKNGLQRISFARILSEIKVFHLNNTIYEDLKKEKKRDSSLNKNKEKIECVFCRIF